MATVWKNPVVLKVVNKLRFQRSLSGWTRTQSLFTQRQSLPEHHGYVPTLSPPQVTSLLTVNESRVEGKAGHGFGSVKSFESNQLGSNQPSEDRRAVGQLIHTKGSLFAVYDGHGGTACAQSVSERLLDYVAASLLSYQDLEKFNHAMKTDSPMDLVRRYVFSNEYSNSEMVHLFRTSLHKFVVETLSCVGLEEDVKKHIIAHALTNAFVRLDADMSAEAQPSGGMINIDSLEVGLSGACACVAHVSDSDLYVANLGDTRAVIGQEDGNGNMKPVPLSIDHNTDNESEVQRIKSAHPTSEASYVLQNNRLLSTLIPLRAFGDLRFKWSIKDLKALADLLDNGYAQNIVFKNYYTPPYLISKPQVLHHKLAKNDRFMVLGSDGLWEMLSNKEIVNLVAEHMEGRQTVDRFRVQDQPQPVLGSINTELVKRKSGLAHKAKDDNCATHLLRHALGYEHRKVSEMLTFPPHISRYYRDDITIIIVYFDNNYLDE